jgi:ATP-dependent Clp protease ATP-binding subunit ClpC
MSEDSRRSGREVMETGCVTEFTRPLDTLLRERIIGQEPSLSALTCSFSRVLSGLRDPSRPVQTLLLLGPTGVGKTETAKALARHLFGWEGALTRINCEEYAHGHELSKLLGAPPGYVGHGLEPLFSQARIDGPHQQARKEGTGIAGAPEGPFTKAFPSGERVFLSIVLFDEIEKAHPILWNAMLGILEGGMLTLGDNSVTDFTRSIIVMTSNVGSRDLGAILDRKRVGFLTERPALAPEVLDLRKAALAAARGMFPIEFLNRFDDILVYTSLERQHLEAIFEKFLEQIHTRALLQAGVPLLIRVGPQAKELILDKGTDPLLGARPLRRAMEVELVDPLSRLIASGRLSAGDVIEVERKGDELVFYRRQNGTSAPGNLEIPGSFQVTR